MGVEHETRLKSKFNLTAEIYCDATFASAVNNYYAKVGIFCNARYHISRTYLPTADTY